MYLLYTASFKEFGSLVCLWHNVKLQKTQLEVAYALAFMALDRKKAYLGTYAFGTMSNFEKRNLRSGHLM